MMFFVGMFLSLAITVIMAPLLVVYWFGLALYKGAEFFLNLCADFVIWLERFA